jgi:hypothetical protein
MDCLRSCYKSQMALYRDRPDVLTDGAWHFCPPGAKPVPYLHAFGSSNWDPDGRFDPPVGELGTGSHPWSNGNRNPRLLGQNVCGTQEQWEKGSLFASKGTPPVAVDGVPLCCVAGPLPATGDGDGGECFQNWGFWQIAEGGAGEDGEAIQFGSGFQTGEGGDSDGGIAVQYGAGYQLAAGGDSDDGQAVQARGDLQLAAGGDSDDGQAVQARGDLQLAAGGDSDDGQAVQAEGWLQVAAGGDGDDGEATQASENGEVWIKYTKPYTDFQTAGTTITVTLDPGAAKQFIHEIVLNVSVAFAGTGLTMVSGQLLYDTGSIISLLDMKSTTTGYQSDSTTNAPKANWPFASALGMGSLIAAKPLKITVTSSGANLSALSAGELEVWVNVSTLP